MMVAATVTVAVLAVLFLPIAASSAAAAPQQQPKLKMTLSKDAYWYGKDGVATFQMSIDNLRGQAVKGVTVRAKVYPANESRAAFDAYLNGKLGSYDFTQTIAKDVSLRPGMNDFSFKINLSEHGMNEGVFPVVVEALQQKTQLTFAGTQVVVLSPKPADPPLQVALVFDVNEPARQELSGAIDDILAVECASSRGRDGWLSQMSSLDHYENLHASIALSPLILDEIQQLSRGAVVKNGTKDSEVSAKSPEAVSAANVLKGFRKLSQTPRFQFLSTPYATPDVEKLWQLKWFSDARGQIDRGAQVLGNILGGISPAYFYPPGLAMDSRVLRNLGTQIGPFMVLNGALLDRSKEGKKLTKPDTLTAPVELKGATGRQTIALFTDTRLADVVARMQPSEDAYGVTQCMVSELANLYLENPTQARAITMVWPSNWRPNQDVFEELMRFFDTTSWVKTANVGETINKSPPANKQPLVIPEVSTTAQASAPGGTDDYFARVALTRNACTTYSSFVFKDNPRLTIDMQWLYVTESDVWRQWGKPAEGLALATSLSENIGAELAKIELPKSPTITVTGAKAKIPVSITNSTGYRVKTTLKLSSNGLSFPSGSSRFLVLEPKENLIDIPVTINKKGKVLFRAKLLAGATVLSTLEMPVQTGAFSTFAIVIVCVLLGIILGLWGGRVLRRRKSARHSTRNKKTGEGEEEPQGT